MPKDDGDDPDQFLPPGVQRVPLSPSRTAAWLIDQGAPKDWAKPFAKCYTVHAREGAPKRGATHKRLPLKMEAAARTADPTGADAPPDPSPTNASQVNAVHNGRSTGRVWLGRKPDGSDAWHLGWDREWTRSLNAKSVGVLAGVALLVFVSQSGIWSDLASGLWNLAPRTTTAPMASPPPTSPSSPSSSELTPATPDPEPELQGEGWAPQVIQNLP
jgi:hypothetical protein